MAPTLQVKLLRVLERRTLRRVGGIKDIEVNVRIVSATNRDLERMVQEGSFREDLYYRLKVVPIYIPPLRERREDILPLARLFMDRFASSSRRISGSRTRPRELLADYPWPGNIRELKNLMERIVLLEERRSCCPGTSLPERAPRPRRRWGQRIDDAINGPIRTDGIAFEQLVE